MNTTQQILISESNSDCLLDSDMANLLKMTNDVMMKIKQQTRGMSL